MRRSTLPLDACVVRRRSRTVKTNYAMVAFALFVECLHAAQGERPTAKAAKYIVHAGPIARSYDCAPGVDGRDIEDGTLYANLRRARDRYLLIGYSEQSVLNNPGRYCGGGVESHLVWLHVRSGMVLETQAALYQSCWESVEGDPPSWSGQFCIVDYESFRSPQTKRRAVFDSVAPEKGLAITSRPSRTTK